MISLPTAVRASKTSSRLGRGSSFRRGETGPWRSTHGGSRVRGAAAGAVAAAVWAAAEPALAKLGGSQYSDVRLLGRLVTRGRAWPLAGLALHLTNGAVFGAAFEKSGLRGVKAGIVAAQVENTVLWPGMAIIDKVHPDRREGNWPPLVRNPRVAVQEIVAHAIFGAVLGSFLRR